MDTPSFLNGSFLKGAIVLIRYQQAYIFSIFAGLTSFFMLKIIYSSHFELVFRKRRYALSFIRFIFLPLIPLKKTLGSRRGETLFSFLFPSLICCIAELYEGIIFSALGVGLYSLLKKKKHPKPKKT